MIVASPDHKGSSARAIRKLADEISSNLCSKLERLKIRINEIRETQMLQERRSQLEIGRLTKLLEESRTKNLTEINRRQELQELLAADEEELSRLEAENQTLQSQVKELLSTNRKLAGRKEEGEQRLSALVSRLQAMKAKHESNLEMQKRLNQEFRTFLGVDILRARDKTLKIVFSHLGVESYVIIDFNKESCVDECVPELNLEKLNFMFKEGNDFYKFIKFVRTEIKKKL